MNFFDVRTWLWTQYPVSEWKKSWGHLGPANDNGRWWLLPIDELFKQRGWR